MKRAIIAVIEVESAPRGAEHEASDEDLIAGAKASLEEFYPTDDLYPFEPSSMRVAVASPDGLDVFLAAATVGLEGNHDNDPGTCEAVAVLDTLETEETHD